MTIAKERNGGDGFHNRLLLYLSKLTGETFLTINKIKQGIWICKTERGKWIVKEFPTTTRLDNQKLLTEKLFEYQFSNTYRFHPIHSKMECIFENKIYGLIAFIEKGAYSFTYQNHQDRYNALNLLKTFHHTTSKFTDVFRPLLKNYNQINKWQFRLNEFKTNLPQLQMLMPKVYPYLHAYLEWAEWSLQKLKVLDYYFLQEPVCIIHGDVAHHNFYLGQDNVLYLIDFDLISLAPANIDELQMANRILPFLSWSFDELFHYETFRMHLNEEAFLYALVFPTDILREWNRFIKTKNQRKGHFDYLLNITLNQYVQRESFVKAIKLRL